MEMTTSFPVIPNCHTGMTFMFCWLRTWATKKERERATLTDASAWEMYRNTWRATDGHSLPVHLCVDSLHNKHQVIVALLEGIPMLDSTAPSFTTIDTRMGLHTSLVRSRWMTYQVPLLRPVRVHRRCVVSFYSCCNLLLLYILHLRGVQHQTFNWLHLTYIRVVEFNIANTSPVPLLRVKGGGAYRPNCGRTVSEKTRGRSDSIPTGCPPNNVNLY